MFRKRLVFMLILSLVCTAAFAAPSSDNSAPQPAFPILTQEQAAVYLACLEESSTASAKDSNPLATLGNLNTLWIKTVKHTSLKGLTMLQLAQVTSSAIRKLAAQQFGKAGETEKVIAEFSTQTPAGCLSIAQSLQP
jgi:hypothetical protein